ncbi:hypothetical protein FVI09_25150 [Escherichia coli]|nr:hypothetical protein [Escherichia coli]
MALLKMVCAATVSMTMCVHANDVYPNMTSPQKVVLYNDNLVEAQQRIRIWGENDANNMVTVMAGCYASPTSSGYGPRDMQDYTVKRIWVQSGNTVLTNMNGNRVEIGEPSANRAYFIRARWTSRCKTPSLIINATAFGDPTKYHLEWGDNRYDFTGKLIPTLTVSLPVQSKIKDDTVVLYPNTVVLMNGKSSKILEVPKGKVRTVVTTEGVIGTEIYMRSGKINVGSDIYMDADDAQRSGLWIRGTRTEPGRKNGTITMQIESL